MKLEQIKKIKVDTHINQKYCIRYKSTRLMFRHNYSECLDQDSVSENHLPLVFSSRRDAVSYLKIKKIPVKELKNIFIDRVSYNAVMMLGYCRLVNIRYTPKDSLVRLKDIFFYNTLEDIKEIKLECKIYLNSAITILSDINSVKIDHNNKCIYLSNLFNDNYADFIYNNIKDDDVIYNIKDMKKKLYHVSKNYKVKLLIFTLTDNYIGIPIALEQVYEIFVDDNNTMILKAETSESIFTYYNLGKGARRSNKDYLKCIEMEALKNDIINFTIDTNKDLNGDIVDYEGKTYFVNVLDEIVFLIEK